MTNSALRTPAPEPGDLTARAVGGCIGLVIGLVAASLFAWAVLEVVGNFDVDLNEVVAVALLVWLGPLVGIKAWRLDKGA